MTESEVPLPLLSRYAIMVDVGYIYASAGELLFSASSRREYRVDADRLIAALIKLADDQVRGQLLRVYWYDAARDRVPTFDQRVIAQMPLVKLRLGNLNSAVHVNAAHLAAARLGPSRERVEESGEDVAQKWILTRGEDNIRDLLPGPILPPVIDKELLVDAEKELGLSLRSYQEAREWLRDAFWARVHRQFGIGVGKSRS